ncbi:MAG: hypothetical protein ACKKL6_04090 [Candidatus Komeilibacteria bacterium]
MDRITPKQQMLVIEKLYRSNDSITSTKKFNDSFGSSVGKIGVKTIYLNDFYRMLKEAKFLRPRIKRIIKEITGQDITIY